MQMQVRHALRILHGVVHSEHNAAPHWPSGRAHAHLGKGRIEALELLNELDDEDVDDQARMNGDVRAEIGLGRGGVELVKLRPCLRTACLPHRCAETVLMNPRPNVSLGGVGRSMVGS